MELDLDEENNLYMRMKNDWVLPHYYENFYITMFEGIFAFSPCCYNSQINKVLETSSIIVVQAYDVLYNLNKYLNETMPI
jgi:hypothetical protein